MDPVKPPQRPSILLRPKAPESRNNLETAEAQYEVEQARFAAVQERRKMIDAERMRWMSDDPNVKASVQCVPAAQWSRLRVASHAWLPARALQTDAAVGDAEALLCKGPARRAGGAAK